MFSIHSILTCIMSNVSLCARSTGSPKTILSIRHLHAMRDSMAKRVYFDLFYRDHFYPTRYITVTRFVQRFSYLAFE